MSYCYKKGMNLLVMFFREINNNIYVYICVYLFVYKYI